MNELEEKLWTTILNQLLYCGVGSVLYYTIFGLDLRVRKLELDLFKVSNQ